MAVSVKVFKCGVLLGSGSQTTTSITSYTGIAPITNRNVQIEAVGGSTVGASYATRVSNDGGGTLTVVDPIPFV